MAGGPALRRADPPAEVRERYLGWEWSPAWVYEDVITTWRLRSAADDLYYLKVRAVEEEPRLLDEADRLRWAHDRLPVPDVVACGTAGDVDWLLLTGLPGRDATTPELKARPDWLVPILARGLRRLHETPPDGCPFRLTVDGALAAVHRRVAEGKVEHADLHEEFRHLSLDDALATLDALAPDTEDPVLCHGDYCFPNVLIEGDAVTAYIDLGELGVADRWWDLAVASWSTTWNIGPGWEQPFLDAYGIEPDRRRMTFYRLLYDLIS